MNARRLLVGGLAFLLVVAGCGSQSPPERRASTATAQPTNEPTQTFSGSGLHPDDRSSTVFAEMQDYREERAVDATEAAAWWATGQAEEASAWKRAVRDCIRAGNSETLCALDPYDPSLR